MTTLAILSSSVEMSIDFLSRHTSYAEAPHRVGSHGDTAVRSGGERRSGWDSVLNTTEEALSLSGAGF